MRPKLRARAGAVPLKFVDSMREFSDHHLPISAPKWARPYCRRKIYWRVPTHVLISALARARPHSGILGEYRHAALSSPTLRLASSDRGDDDRSDEGSPVVEIGVAFGQYMHRGEVVFAEQVG